jgi:hypothetical protein
MTGNAIQVIQDYLTISNGNGETRKMVDVEFLLKRHPPLLVIGLLRGLFKKKEEKLVYLVDLDKSRMEIDRIIGEMFRLHMAIRMIKKETEEVKETCPS